MRISWIDPKDLIEYEIRQLELEGKNVDRLNSEWNSIKRKIDNEKEVLRFKNHLYEKYNQSSYFLEERKKLEYFIEGKFKSVPIKYDLNQLSESELYDKLYGGWVGRASGCLLGKPIEKYSRSIIKEILTVSKQWPLQDYISGEKIPDEILQKYPWNKHSGKESLKENIEYMTEDDDLNYAMINLSIAEYFGLHFTTENVAETWLELLPDTIYFHC